jgi:Carboxypeptidase regulatory-like domain
MARRFLRAFAGFVVSVFGFAVHVSAQQLATLTTSVSDPAGRAVTQALVTVANRETGAKRSEHSTASGVAVIPGLPAENYELTVEANQFNPYSARLTLPTFRLQRVC